LTHKSYTRYIYICNKYLYVLRHVCVSCILFTCDARANPLRADPSFPGRRTLGNRGGCVRVARVPFSFRIRRLPRNLPPSGCVNSRASPGLNSNPPLSRGFFSLLLFLLSPTVAIGSRGLPLFTRNAEEGRGMGGGSMSKEIKEEASSPRPSFSFARYFYSPLTSFNALLLHPPVKRTYCVCGYM